MANNLDELRDDTIEEGLDTKVINKKIRVTVGSESTLYQLGMWLVPIVVLGVIGFVLKKEYGSIALIICLVIGFVPGIIFEIMKVKADSYLLQLEQAVQSSASTIDNYLEQRVQILTNVAKLVDKAVDLDKDVFVNVASLRGNNGRINDENRNEVANSVDTMSRNINLAFENYPDLKAHSEIEDAMQQNSYLQREITAAREKYNSTVLLWNREIFEWPVKRIVAAKKGYETRIPFIVDNATKQQARGSFF